MKESIWVQIIKCVLLCLSAIGYTWPLVSGLGHAIAAIAVILAALLAAFCAHVRVRTIWCLLLAGIITAIGLSGSYFMLNIVGGSTLAATIHQSQFWYFMGIVFGIVFASRSLALRFRTAQLIESSLLIGTLVYIFFAHRDFNLNNPRDFADYLYGNGYDPITIYRYMGIGAAFLSLPLLFSKVKPGKAIYSLAILAILSLLAGSLLESAHLPVNTEDPLGLMSDNDKNNPSDNDDNSDSDNDDNNDNENGGGNSDNNDNNKSNNNNNNGPTGNEKPIPIAIAVFYDEFTPGDGIFHFRQNVLSDYDGNHLIGSAIDKDVISTLPLTNALEAVPMQTPALHDKISTSMFLMQSHAQPPQLAMGQKLFPIQNPDPKLFVSSYGVESLGLSLDLIRLIGRRSIPADWTQEQKAHYLEIPDDPRYRALSDIIVRQIDPRFAGDDVVKALYIKSWLEKEGYYTMKTKHIDATDPTASFLFGSLRGYCVHFAHSAVYLLRSQGIAARVAIGYAIDNRLRGTNSAVLIMANQAHAWPEIHVDGVGWVTLEIFPENGDADPPSFVDQSLESLFGELARNDKSGGRSPEARDSNFEIPWRTIWLCLGGFLIFVIAGAYGCKFYIIFSAKTRQPQHMYRVLRGAVAIWSMYGHHWRKAHHSLEAFAKAIPGSDSATAKLIDMASEARLGHPLNEDDMQKAADLFKLAQTEAAQQTPAWRRFLGWINPVIRF